MKQKFIQLVIFMLLAVPNLMAADTSKENNKVMIEMKVNNDSSRFNDFDYDIFNAADSAGVSHASAVTKESVLQIWGIEKGRRYFIIITPYNKHNKPEKESAQKSKGDAKNNLSGGITRVAGGTRPHRVQRYITPNENDIRIDVDIPADFQTDEKRQIGWSATPVFTPVFVLPALNVAQH